MLNPISYMVKKDQLTLVSWYSGVPVSTLKSINSSTYPLVISNIWKIRQFDAVPSELNLHQSATGISWGPPSFRYVRYMDRPKNVGDFWRLTSTS